VQHAVACTIAEHGHSADRSAALEWVSADAVDDDVVYAKVTAIWTIDRLAGSRDANAAGRAGNATATAVAGVGVDVYFATVGWVVVAIKKTIIAASHRTLPVDTGGSTVHANADSATRSAVEGVVCERCWIDIVDYTVAIVVESITGFWLRRCPALARAPGAVRLAHLSAWYTGTDSGATGLGCARSAPGGNASA